MQYYIRSMNGTFRLPSPVDMTQHWEEEKRDRTARGFTKRQTHMMGPDQVNIVTYLHTTAYVILVLVAEW